MTTTKNGTQRIEDQIHQCIVLMDNYAAMLSLYEHIKANEVLKLSPNYEIICQSLIAKGRAVHEQLSMAQLDLFSLPNWDPGY